MICFFVISRDAFNHRIKRMTLFLSEDKNNREEREVCRLMYRKDFFSSSLSLSFSLSFSLVNSMTLLRNELSIKEACIYIAYPQTILLLFTLFFYLLALVNSIDGENRWYFILLLLLFVCLRVLLSRNQERSYQELEWIITYTYDSHLEKNPSPLKTGV